MSGNTKVRKAIYGLFPDPESAQGGLEALRAAKVDLGDLTVISSQPHEEFEFGRIDHRTPMPWLAALGGLVGGVSGYVLAAFTQKSYPIATGGMPIVTNWANGIITYELTMLGAILVTLFTLLVTARIPDWRTKIYDPAVSEGRILVGVVNPQEDSRVELKRALSKAGAVETKEVG
ncbi:MAG: quinol:electron acceptor oxidoreductase subunit ActD [Terriglobia bacterium]